MIHVIYSNFSYAIQACNNYCQICWRQEFFWIWIMKNSACWWYIYYIFLNTWFIYINLSRCKFKYKKYSVYKFSATAAFVDVAKNQVTTSSPTTDQKLKTYFMFFIFQDKLMAQLYIRLFLAWSVPVATLSTNLCILIEDSSTLDRKIATCSIDILFVIWPFLVPFGVVKFLFSRFR